MLNDLLLNVLDYTHNALNIKSKTKMSSTTPRLRVTTPVSLHLDFVLFLPGIGYPCIMGVVNIF